jgi:RNA polymerase sigma-70 factor (ECF subfamily)
VHYDIVTLFREHASRVERLLRRFGVAERDVADATQEVFVVVHRKLGEFEGRASVSTWLYQICLRVASAERRRARHRRELLGDDVTTHEQSDQSDLHTQFERRRLLEHIADALDELSEAQRTALVLHELEGLHVREIARRLRVPVKTAFSRLYAARAQLRTMLRRQGYAVPMWFPLWPGTGWQTWPTRKSAAISGSAQTLVAKSGLAAAFAVCATLLTPPREPEPQPHAVAQPAPAVLPQRSSPTLEQRSQPHASMRVAPKRAATHFVLAPARARATEPAPASSFEPTPEDLTLIRMGATDLTPTIEHPFAAKLRTPSPSVPPMAAKLAPSSFDLDVPR